MQADKTKKNFFSHATKRNSGSLCMVDAANDMHPTTKRQTKIQLFRGKGGTDGQEGERLEFTSTNEARSRRRNWSHEEGVQESCHFGIGSDAGIAGRNCWRSDQVPGCQPEHGDAGRAASH